jgi:hypothetical protein
VFGLEGSLFVLSAILAWRLGRPAGAGVPTGTARHGGMNANNHLKGHAT